MVERWENVASVSDASDEGVAPLDEPSPRGTVAGTVTDDAGAALAGVLVRVENGPSDITDAQGNYEIEGGLYGPAHLIVDAPG